MTLVAACASPSLPRALSVDSSPGPRSSLAATPLQRLVGGWIEAYNTGDTAAIRRFAAARFDTAALRRQGGDAAQLMIGTYGETRGMDPMRVAYENSERIAVDARARLTGHWLRLTFRSTGDSTRPLVFLGFFFSAPPPDVAPRDRIADAAIADSVRAFAKRLASAGEWSGSLAISQRGRTTLADGRGASSDLNASPNLPVTPFELGTFRRVFVGVAACKLVAEGKLDLQSPVARHVPELRDARVRALVTVSHLLSNTSGLGDLSDKPGFDTIRTRIRAPADYLPLVAAETLSFEPGADVQSSEVGTALLSLVVERAAGEALDAYIIRSVLVPAGMMQTRLDGTGSRAATGHRVIGWRSAGPASGLPTSPSARAPTTPEVSLSPFRGGASTAEDLVRLGEALMSGSLLGAAMTRTFVGGEGTVGPGEWPVGQSTCGFAQSTDGVRMLTASGSNTGNAVRLEIFPGRGAAVATLSNFGGPANAYLANCARDMLVRAKAPTRPAVVGNVKVLHDIDSRFLPGHRRVRVYLPPGYDANPVIRYPVLYLHDGQEVFGGSWRVDQTLERSIRNGELPPIIVVAVDNAGADYRFDEYTPSRVRGQGGSADAYGRFVVEELKPVVDSLYRTLRDRAHTAIGGSSLGGLVSLYLTIRRSDMFGAAVVMSPSVYWDDRLIVKLLPRLVPSAAAPRIWLDVGTAEGADELADVRSLRDTMIAHGWAVGRTLGYMEGQGASHHAPAWARRMLLALRFVFAGSE